MSEGKTTNERRSVGCRGGGRGERREIAKLIVLTGGGARLDQQMEGVDRQAAANIIVPNKDEKEGWRGRRKYGCITSQIYNTART